MIKDKNKKIALTISLFVIDIIINAVFFMLIVFDAQRIFSMVTSYFKEYWAWSAECLSLTILMLCHAWMFDGKRSRRWFIAAYIWGILFPFPNIWTCFFWPFAWH